jgi:hypothetical protein
MATSSTPDMQTVFWILLCVGCAAGIVQVIYMFVFYRNDGTDAKSNILAVFVSPLISYVCTWIYIFGVVFLLLDTLRKRSPTDLDHSHDQLDVLLVSLRTAFYSLIVLACSSLFVHHLGSMSLAFGHSLSDYWKLDVFLDTGADEDVSHNHDIAQPATIGVNHNSQSEPIDLEQRSSANRHQDSPPTISKGTGRIAVVIVCHVALIALQIPQGWEGSFRGAFLATFGLNCAALAVILAYYLILLSSPDQLSRSLLRVWTPMPLTIVLVESWCFGTQVAEFFVNAKHTHAQAFFELISQLNTGQLFMFVFMTLCYFTLVVLGAATTRTHLHLLATAKALYESRMSNNHQFSGMMAPFRIPSTETLTTLNTFSPDSADQSSSIRK